eukprot:scaffold10253_cov124-Isochrysis_galbana.AAC.24
MLRACAPYGAAYFIGHVLRDMRHTPSHPLGARPACTNPCPPGCLPPPNGRLRVLARCQQVPSLALPWRRVERRAPDTEGVAPAAGARQRAYGCGNRPWRPNCSSVALPMGRLTTPVASLNQPPDGCRGTMLACAKLLTTRTVSKASGQ